MNLKELLKSKTFYAGLGLIIAGIGTWATGGSVAEAIQMMLNGAGLIFLRQGVQKSGPLLPQG